MEERKAETSSAFAGGETIGRTTAEVMTQLESEIFRHPMPMLNPIAMTKLVSDGMQKIDVR